MERYEFLGEVTEQLQRMPTQWKDIWIMRQAKLLPESAQQDFLMSLRGEKLVAYMPTLPEISAFCEQVQKGEIYVEYETHYYEFDSEGNYMDDWKSWHNDPLNAFDFLEKVFHGCHDLLKLEEYGLAARVLEKVCRLKFPVKEAEESEDCEEDPTFTILNAVNEDMLSMSAREIGYDWCVSLLVQHRDDKSAEFAGKIADILESELCREIQPSDFLEYISEELLEVMDGILEERIRKCNARLEKVQGKESHFWREKYMQEKKKARCQHLQLDIRKNCRKENRKPEPFVLGKAWTEIRDLLKALSYEPYIDDQFEIEEVWEICKELTENHTFEGESWSLRKRILEDLVRNDYYDYYGCGDPLGDLAKKLYITDEETREFAEILNQYGKARAAADLYRKLGEREKYVAYLETHLGKGCREYLELIECYQESGNESGTREAAEQGLKKCTDDLTDLFIFLLLDAREQEDEDRYKKLYASAKRRRRANIVRVDKALEAD